MILVSLRKKLYHWLRDADKNHCYPEDMKIRTLSSADRYSSNSGDRLSSDNNGMYFKVIPGNGGVVIEISQYDAKTDRQHNALYVIPENDDLAGTLAKIITMQALKH